MRKTARAYERGDLWDAWYRVLCAQRLTLEKNGDSVDDDSRYRGHHKDLYPPLLTVKLTTDRARTLCPHSHSPHRIHRILLTLRSAVVDGQKDIPIDLALEEAQREIL